MLPHTIQAGIRASGALYSCAKVAVSTAVRRLRLRGKLSIRLPDAEVFLSLEKLSEFVCCGLSLGCRGFVSHTMR